MVPKSIMIDGVLH